MQKLSIHKKICAEEFIFLSESFWEVETPALTPLIYPRSHVFIAKSDFEFATHWPQSLPPIIEIWLIAGRVNSTKVVRAMASFLLMVVFNFPLYMPTLSSISAKHEFRM